MKARSKPYRPGDRFTVLIPDNISPEALKFINSQKFISPAVIDVVEEKVKRTYKNNEERNNEKDGDDN